MDFESADGRTQSEVWAQANDGVSARLPMGQRAELDIPRTQFTSRSRPLRAAACTNSIDRTAVVRTKASQQSAALGARHIKVIGAQLTIRSGPNSVNYGGLRGIRGNYSLAQTGYGERAGRADATEVRQELRNAGFVGGRAREQVTAVLHGAAGA